VELAHGAFSFFEARRKRLCIAARRHLRNKI
jgi:hypothetical protein